MSFPLSSPSFVNALTISILITTLRNLETADGIVSPLCHALPGEASLNKAPCRNMKQGRREQM